MSADQIISLMDFGREHVRDGRPRRPRPRRLHAALRSGRRLDLEAVHRDPQGRPVAAADRSHLRDRPARRCRPRPRASRCRPTSSARTATAAPPARTSASSRARGQLASGSSAPPSAFHSSSSSWPGRSASIRAAIWPVIPIAFSSSASTTPRSRRGGGCGVSVRARSTPKRRLRRPPLTTLTVVRAQPLGSREEAEEWLARVRESEEALDAEVTPAIALANAAVHAHRGAALDPNVADVSRDHALAVRVGYGIGDDLVEGSWEQALAAPALGRPPAPRPGAATAGTRGRGAGGPRAGGRL